MSVRRWAQTFADGGFSTWMARLNARHPWSHNDHFHSWILTHLPDERGVALDVGCGHGELVAQLAPHFAQVIGSEADPSMVAHARRRCAGLPNVTITDGDWRDGDEPLDLVTMIAVLHHLDIPDALQAIARRLSPGGRFLSVGLAPPQTVRDHAWDLASMITNPIIGYVKHPWPSGQDVPRPAPYPIRDPTVSVEELRLLLDEIMPGAVLRHRLAFRHTIAWTKPS